MVESWVSVLFLGLLVRNWSVAGVPEEFGCEAHPGRDHEGRCPEQAAGPLVGVDRRPRRERSDRGDPPVGVCRGGRRQVEVGRRRIRPSRVRRRRSRARRSRPGRRGHRSDDLRDPSVRAKLVPERELGLGRSEVGGVLRHGHRGDETARTGGTRMAPAADPTGALGPSAEPAAARRGRRAAGQTNRLTTIPATTSRRRHRITTRYRALR